MLAFILRRLVQALIVMLVVAFIAFMLFQYVGDPVTNILGQDATPAQRQELRADLGLDQPFPLQFARVVGNAARGEFGLSLRQGRRVSALIAERDCRQRSSFPFLRRSSRYSSACRWASTRP